MDKLNIENIIKLWENEKKIYVKKSTFATYKLLIEKHLLPYFGNMFDFEERCIQNFVLFKTSQGLSQKTIKDMIVILKMIFNFAVKHNFLSYKKLDIKFIEDKDSARLQILNKLEYKKIVSYLKIHFSFKNLGILLCLSTGMRIGEICALKWRDVDINSGVINVRRTLQRIYTIENEKRFTELICDLPKTKCSIRDVPITDEIMKIVKPFKKLAYDDFFVLSNCSKPIEPRTYRNYYKKLLNELGIENIKFHGLRHSFATRCIESKGDYKTVSTILGHSNINTTLNLYVHPNLEQKKKCVEQMFKMLK